jgi:flagellar basal-body rod modification protein FlgD
MTTNAVSSNSIYSSLGLTGSTPTAGSSAAASAASAATSAASTAVNEQEFLQLMTTQLQDQDPTNPVSSTDFFSQIAQFSEVSGIDQLNSSFSSLSSTLASSQTLQAASLIGQSVMVTGSTGELTSSGLSGAVQVPASGDVKVNIYNSSGTLVNTLDLGVQSAGTVPFTWNGNNSGGSSQATGAYTISAQVGSGSSAQSAPTEVVAQVLSVSPTSSGMMLNLQGLGQVALSQVQQIN